jgi:hypothetical protein
MGFKPPPRPTGIRSLPFPKSEIPNDGYLIRTVLGDGYRRHIRYWRRIVALRRMSVIGLKLSLLFCWRLLLGTVRICIGISLQIVNQSSIGGVPMGTWTEEKLLSTRKGTSNSGPG